MCFVEHPTADGGGIFKPAGFGVQWSPDLAAMLPELAEVRFPALQSSENLTEFVNACKDALQGKLDEAATAWEERSKAMLKLVDIFADREGVVVNLDFDTMTGMDIVFRSRNKRHIYTVTFFTGYKRGDCKVEYCSQMDNGRTENWCPNEFSAEDLKDIDLGKNLLEAIKKDIAEDFLEVDGFKSVATDS